MERKPSKYMNGWILFFAGLCCLCFGAVIVRLFWMQVIDYDFYREKASGQQTKVLTVEAKRGAIYDTNGKTLAISIETQQVTLEAVKIKTEEQVELVARGLSDILGLDYDSTLATVQKKATWTLIKRGVDQDTADTLRQYIKENGLGSIIYLSDDTTRYYPYGSFLSHILGFTGTDNNGLYGLESYYDEQLSGTDGRIVKATNAAGTELSSDYEQYYEAQDGNNLVLTIDAFVQQCLEENLETAVQDNKVRDHVSGIVMDVKTGAILAMANKPDFDPNAAWTLTDSAEAARIAAIQDPDKRKAELNKALTEQWRNKAISNNYYPGSTFKIVTASSALETGAVGTDSSFYCPGFRQVMDHKIHCWKTEGHGPETLAQAVQNSCNPAFIEIGTRLGIRNFYKYFKAFGLTEKTGIDLPGEASGYFWDVNRMTEVDLAVLSFGQNFGITPLQLLTAVSTVANNGNAVIPHVVKEITDKNGSVVHTTQTAATRQVISQETSATIREILESVVTTGTGKNAYIAGYRVAGKTGTSEKVDVGEGAYVSSFVAFAPADDPQVAILILLDEPTVQPITGGITVAPIVRRVLSEVLPYLGVEPEYTEAELAQKDVTVPDLTNLSGYDAFNKAKWVGLTTLTQGSGDKVTDQIPAPGSTVSQGSQVILYMGGSKPADTVTVPDLNKMSVQRVKSALADIGLYVKTSGVNSAGTRVVAIKQSVEPGTKVPVGTVITVEFNDLDQTAE